MKNEVKEFRLDEISILCIIRDLLKNIWVILLAAAAGWFAGKRGHELPVCAGIYRPGHHGSQCER